VELLQQPFAPSKADIAAIRHTPDRRRGAARARRQRGLSSLDVLVDGAGNPLGHDKKGGILARPFAARHGLAIRRQPLQPGKVAVLPQAGPQNDRDHTSSARLVPRHRALELDTTHVV